MDSVKGLVVSGSWYCKGTVTDLTDNNTATPGIDGTDVFVFIGPLSEELLQRLRLSMGGGDTMRGE